MTYIARGAGFDGYHNAQGRKPPIGTLGFYKWVPSACYQADRGYDLEKECWGKGIITDEMEAVIDFRFKKMELNRIEVHIMPRNKQSIRMIKNLGFKKEGLIRERYFDEFGNYADDLLFSMLRPDQGYEGNRDGDARDDSLRETRVHVVSGFLHGRARVVLLVRNGSKGPPSA